MTALAAQVPPLPMLFYFFYEDLSEVDQRAGAGRRAGHPHRASAARARRRGERGRPGRQHRAAGPAGTRSPPSCPPTTKAASGSTSCRKPPRSRPLGAVFRRPARQPPRTARRCPDPAEIKLADSLGAHAWVCLAHADQILVTVPAAFIASHDDRGLAAYLGRR